MVLPFAGSYYWLQHQKKHIKKEIKAQIVKGIDREELVLLCFSKNEANNKLRWKHSKEFEYNNEMYDVVEKEEKGSFIYYWCWWDHEETKLNKQLQKLIAIALGNNPENKNCKDQLQQFYKCLSSSFLQLPQFTFPVNLSTSSNLYFFSAIAHYNIPPSPPPQIS